MQFAFVHVHGNAERHTMYSKENQERLKYAFNSNAVETTLFHETEFGQHRGRVVQHLINFKNRTVENLYTKIMYMLVVV